MNNIDFLEHGGGQAMVRLRGEIFPLPDPRAMNFQAVLLALSHEIVPGLPANVPMWMWPVVFDRWRAANDLPPFADARRLTYLVDHYRPAIANDLAVYANVDLGDLWRARRWVKLLDLIDRLPGHSHYMAAVANDEEHAEMVAAAQASRREAGEEPEVASGPSLVTWSPEVAALTRLTDAVNSVRHAVVAVQVGKKAGDPPKPEPRPVTAMAAALKRAEYNRRKAKHESLVARVLPHKAPVKG